MADLSRTIEIIFDSVDNTAGVFGSISEDVGNLNRSINEATQPFADITQGILAAEAAALAMGAAFATVAVNQAGEFSGAFNEIATLITATDEDLNTFKGNLLDYASTSTQSFEDITTATYNAISAGVDYEDAIEAIAIAEQLAVAGKTDLNTAMELLVPTLNAYGVGMEEAGAYSDVMFTAVREGKTTLEELSGSLGRVTPVAAALGVPIQEVSAAFAALTSNGLGTAEAGTAVKATLNAILSPSAAAAEAAAELGVAMGGSALKAEGLDGWLQQLMEATGGNVDEISSMIGSSEALSGILSLLSNDAESWNSSLAAMETSTGATGTAFETMAENAELAKQRLANAVNGMMTQAGDPLLAGWTGIQSALADVFLALGSSFDEGAFDPIYAAFNGFSADLIDILTATAENLPEALAGVDWTEFIDALGGVGDALGGLFGDIDLTSAEGLEQAIQSIVGVGTGLLQMTESIVEAFGPFVGAIGDAVNWFNQLEPSTRATAGEFLGISTAVNTVTGLMQPLFNALDGVLGLFTTLLAMNVVTQLRNIGGAATTASAGFSALGPVVAAVGAAYAGWEAGRWIADKLELGEKAEWLGQVYAHMTSEVEISGAALESASEKFRLISEATGLTITSIEEMQAAISSGALSWDEIDAALGRTVASSQEATNEFSASNEAMIANSDAALGVSTAMEGITASLGLAADGTQVLATDQEDLTTALAGGAVAIRDAEGHIIGYEQGMRSAAAASEDAAESLELSAEKAAEMELAWAELASQERQLMFQAAADIRVAEIEADAERVVASMEMLSASFESTGEVLGDLFALWGETDSVFDRSQIEDWIEREYAIREGLAEAQLELTRAEVERIEAQTEMLERGGVELNISSDGLEPALEAFMFQVIDKVRVAVSGSYEEFLIGAGCSA